MARMKLLRLPTEAELEDTSMEAHTFLEAFNDKAISGFVAEVEDEGDAVRLDDWLINKASWFVVEN